MFNLIRNVYREMYAVYRGYTDACKMYGPGLFETDVKQDGDKITITLSGVDTGTIEPKTVNVDVGFDDNVSNLFD